MQRKIWWLVQLAWTNAVLFWDWQISALNIKIFLAALRTFLTMNVSSQYFSLLAEFLKFHIWVLFESKYHQALKRTINVSSSHLYQTTQNWFDWHLLISASGGADCAPPGGKRRPRRHGLRPRPRGMRHRHPGLCEYLWISDRAWHSEENIKVN